MLLLLVAFYLRRSRQIRERKAFFFLLLLLGGAFFSLPCTVFLGCERAKTLSKKGCDKAKILSQNGCDKAKTLSQNGCEKAKTLSKILFSTPQISESIPFLFFSSFAAAVAPHLLFPLRREWGQQGFKHYFWKVLHYITHYIPKNVIPIPIHYF